MLRILYQKSLRAIKSRHPIVIEQEDFKRNTHLRVVSECRV